MGRIVMIVPRIVPMVVQVVLLVIKVPMVETSRPPAHSGVSDTIGFRTRYKSKFLSLAMKTFPYLGIGFPY